MPGLALGPAPLRFILDGNSVPQESPAVHCGAAMQLTTPALALERASYTFAPEDSAGAALPPVWRCACGFQLDAWAGGAPAGYPAASFPA